MSISSSGYYKLSNDIIDHSGNCFSLSGNDIIIDLNGYIIDGAFRICICYK